MSSVAPRGRRQFAGAAVLIAVLLGAICAAGPQRAIAQGLDDQALALQFRPHLYFDSKERWRPIDVDRFLAEPGHRACALPPAAVPCAPLTNVAQLVLPVVYLDLRGTRRDGSDAAAPDVATCQRSAQLLLDCDRGGRSIIYAHVTREPARIVIDYWWFLRYNAYSIDRHEGDWEGASVVTDAAGTQVRDAHLAAHKGVYRYLAGVTTFDGTHVVVYVARGSHASYPRRCQRNVLPCSQPAGAAPEGRYNGKSPWIANDDGQCAQRCVALLPVANGAATSWNAWNGRWGRRGAKLGQFPPPVTPSFQPRYQHPFDSQLSHRTNFHG